MKKGHPRRAHGAAYPAKRHRESENAAEVTRLSAQADGESPAELRLRSLISEMEKFDSLEEDDAPEPLGDDEISVSHWHWSDDSSDPD